ncbi:MAG: hypothetical protein KDA55_23470, partial [Planctomycetales bacterium]|nr:hypothetical protein [Planctomycetales bacterium]
MPITSFDSYITTANEFVAHWTEVNSQRTAATLPALTLQGGYSLANFMADRDAADDKVAAFQSLENDRTFATGDRDDRKDAIHERLDQFRSALRIHVKDSLYDRSAPTLPQKSVGEQKFRRPFEDMEDLWEKLDADNGVPGFTPPLTLRGGYTFADYQADLEALSTAFRTVTNAENMLRVARGERDTMLANLRERMGQYRAAIALEYDESHALFVSMPQLWPTVGNGGGGDDDGEN